MPKMPLNEKINTKHTCLLVIDIQIDFASPSGLLAKKGRDLSEVENMIGKLKTTIDTANEKEVLTLYTQQIYDRKHLNELQKEQYDLDGKLVTCDIGTEGYKLYKINPPESEVYVKYNFNAFSNNDLIARLRQRNIKTIIVTGMDTIYCVETAIRNAFDLGYKVVVATDLVAGNAKNKDLAEKTLEMASRMGVTTTSDEIIEIWKTEY